MEAGFVTVSLVDTAADSALVGGAEEVGPGNDVITLDLDADFELTRRGDYVLQVNADSNPYSEEHAHTSAQFLQHSRSVAITEEPVLTLTVINTAQNPTDNAYFLMPLLSFPLGAPEYSPDAVTQGFKIDYVPSAGLGTTPMTAIWNEGDRSIVGQRLTFEENPPLGDPDFILRNVNISVGINGEEYSATLDAPANNATLAPIKGFDFRYVENSIVVEWDPVGGADNYIVFVHSSGNRVYFEMTTDTELTVHNSDEFPVTSDPNNLYQIQVIAVDSDPLIPETRALSGSHAHGLLDTYP